MLLNFALAGGISKIVIAVGTFYLISVRIASRQTFRGFRVFGCGCHVEFDAIPPGANEHDDHLAFQVVSGAFTRSDTIDCYVTNSVGDTQHSQSIRMILFLFFRI